MEQRKNNASASGGKKESNFLTKTAHSIRNKVQGLTGNSDTKKDKQERKQKKKKNERKFKIFSKSNATKTTDSDEDIDGTKSESSPTVFTTTKSLNGLDDNKTNKGKSKLLAAALANTKNFSDKQSSNDLERKSFDDHRNTTNSSLSSFPQRSPRIKSIETTQNNDITNQIHFSFAGIFTVDDLLDRIGEITAYGHHATPDLNKKKSKKPGDLDTETSDEDDEDEEVIYIDYNDIRSIDDLLSKIHQQPGNRQVILKNAPNNSTTIILQEPHITSSKSNYSHENHQSLSNNPMSNDTSTKTSTSQDNHIDVNIQNAHRLSKSNDDINQVKKHTLSPKQREELSDIEISEQQMDINQVRRKSGPSSAKLFLISKTHAIDKYDDDDSIIDISKTSKPKPSNSFSSTSSEETHENETSDWL